MCTLELQIESCLHASRFSLWADGRQHPSFRKDFLAASHWYPQCPGLASAAVSSPSSCLSMAPQIYVIVSPISKRTLASFFPLALVPCGKTLKYPSLCLPSSFIQAFYLFLSVCGCLPECIDVHHVGTVPKDAGRVHQIPWNWSDRWLRAPIVSA